MLGMGLATDRHDGADGEGQDAVGGGGDPVPGAQPRPLGESTWERRVLARSLLMTTERRGSMVLRRPGRWWPGRMRRWLLNGQLRQAERFASVLPLPVPRLVLLPDGPALMQPF